MRLIVTGATGYLGRHLVPALQSLGHSVIGLGSADADLTQDGALDFLEGRYDQVWHLAAWTQAGDFCLHHPGEQWIINQRINTNILDWWRRKAPEAKLIAIGSSCSYAPGQELVEENYLSGEPVPELYAYGMTKRMLLIGQRALHTQYGLRYLYLVPSTLMGPGYHTQGKQLHFIFDLIRKIVEGGKSGREVALWGDGWQKREVVDVGDFVKAAIALSESADNDLFNIGSGEERTIRWYAEQICRQTGFDSAAIRYDTTRYVGVRSKQLSVHKLKSVLPGFRFTPTAEALKRTVSWYAEALNSETGPEKR